MEKCVESNESCMRVQIKDAEQALQTSRETVHSAVEEFGAKVLDSMVVLSMQGW